MGADQTQGEGSEAVIGVGYFAAVKCGNETIHCTCRHEKKTVLERINTVASASKFMRLEITTAVFLQNEEVFLD
jgi:hypothetical protein